MKDLLSLAGGTPLARITTPLPHPHGGFWAKLEGFGVGSMKARAAVSMLTAALAPDGALVLIVMLVHLPDIARLVRACAVEAGSRPAVDAMRLQGEGWWRITIGFVARSMARVLATDAGTRLTGSLYLIAAASFLGVGVPPDAGDWAVMIDRNRGGLFLNPWAVLAPALMIVMLAVGLNLTVDRVLKRAHHAPR